MPGYPWVFPGTPGYAWVPPGMPGYPRVCPGMPGYPWYDRPETVQRQPRDSLLLFGVLEVLFVASPGSVWPVERPKSGRDFIITTLSEYRAQMYMSGLKVMS